MAKDYARERNKPFYAKTKVNAFANFEVGRLIKKVVRKSGYIDPVITIQVFSPGLLDEQQTFEAGFEAPDNVTIPLSVPDDDIALEPDEVHIVTLSLVTSPDWIVLSPSEASITVIDDDDRKWMCTYIYYAEPYYHLASNIRMSHILMYTT